MNTIQKILIVDDRKENLIVLQKSLKDVDAEIISAQDGESALRAAVDNQFALAILDIQMPGMNGYELAELLRGDPGSSAIPIIFMSAVYSDDTHVFKGYEAGAVDFIVKPYNPKHLKCKVNVFLELNRINSELSEKLELLAASEDRFKSLVRTIPDIVYRINEEGYFTYINDAIRQLGFSPAELIGAHFRKIIHPEDVENVSRKIVLKRLKNPGKKNNKIIKLFDERRSGDRKTTELQIRLAVKQTSDQKECYTYAEINSSGITTNSSRRKKIFIGTVGVIRDISLRKAAEDKLYEYQSSLEKLVDERTAKLKKEIIEKERLLEERSKIESKMIQQQKLESIGVLAGGVAHEINNPINGIMNYAQLILDSDKCPQELTDYSQSIIHETERVSLIVRNLLQFARADQQSTIETVSVKEMVDYVLSLVKTIARHSNISISTEMPEPVPEIICRRGEIEQVLMNLITNASDALNEKYNGYHEDKRIIIKANTIDKEGAEFIRISVKDFGPGIRAEDYDRVLEPFFTTKNRTKGTGLGLSISHGIVEAHEGTLSFNTEYGKYTEFIVDLPKKN